MSAEASRIELFEVRTPAQMAAAHALRRRVFIEEQGVPEALERDADDDGALHVIALDGGVAIGCGRMVAAGDHVKIGRMAVLLERRRTGVGRQILAYLMEAARRQGFRQAILHAQLTAEGFYLKQGYIPRGAPFEEAGIMHRLMDHLL